MKKSEIIRAAIISKDENKLKLVMSLFDVTEDEFIYILYITFLNLEKYELVNEHALEIENLANKIGKLVPEDFR